MERLDKIIASTGRWSRKDVKIMVKKGLIRVDGMPVKAPDIKVDPDNSAIVVDGEDIVYRRYTWVMLNKPAGCLSVTEASGERTVLDLLPAELAKQKLFPVGRLDRDTEGLLLLTNEGKLAHLLLSPTRHVDKVYFVRVAGRLCEEDVLAFQRGITLEDGTLCRSAVLEISEGDDHNKNCCYVTLREGKYHQVKRMLEALGKPVIYLERVSFAGIPLDENLGRGEYRYLQEAEVDRLRHQIGLFKQ